MEFNNVNDGKVLKVTIALSVSGGKIIVPPGDTVNMITLIPALAANRQFETIPILEVVEGTANKYGDGAVILPILKNIKGDPSTPTNICYELIGFELAEPGNLYTTANLKIYDCTTSITLSGTQNGEWKNYKAITVDGNITVGSFSLANPDGGKLKLQATTVNINNNINAQNKGWINPGAGVLTEVPINILEYVPYWPLQKPADWTWTGTGFPPVTEPTTFTDIAASISAFLSDYYYITADSRIINPNHYKVLKNINPNLVQDYEWPSSKPTTWLWQNNGAAEPAFSGRGVYLPLWNNGTGYYYDNTVSNNNSQIPIPARWNWVDNGAAEPSPYLSDIASALLDHNSYYRFENVDVNTMIYNGYAFCISDINDFFPKIHVNSLRRPCYTLNYNDVGTNFTNTRYIEYNPDFQKWFISAGLRFEFTAVITSELTGVGAKFRYTRMIDPITLNKVPHPCYINDNGYTLSYDPISDKYVILYLNPTGDYTDALAYTTNKIHSRIISDHRFTVNPNKYTYATWPALSGSPDPTTKWYWVGAGSHMNPHYSLNDAKNAYGSGAHWEFIPTRTEYPDGTTLVDGNPIGGMLNPPVLLDYLDITKIDFPDIINSGYCSSLYPYYEMKYFTAPTSQSLIIRKWNQRNGGYNDDSISGGYDPTLNNNRIFRFDEMNALLGSGGTDLIAGGGHVIIQAENINLASSKSINVSTTSNGSGGTITLMARNTLVLDGTLNTSSSSGKNGLVRIFCHPNLIPTLAGNNVIFSTVTSIQSENINELFGQIENFDIKQLVTSDYSNLGSPRLFSFTFPWTDVDVNYKKINLMGKEYHGAIDIHRAPPTWLNRLQPLDILDITHWKELGINPDTTSVTASVRGALLNPTTGDLQFLVSMTSGWHDVRVIGEYQYFKDWNSLMIITSNGDYETSNIKIFKIYDIQTFDNPSYSPDKFPEITGPVISNYAEYDLNFDNVILNKNDVVTIRVQKIPLTPISGYIEIYRVGEHLLLTLKAKER